MSTHISTFDSSIFHDSDTIKDALILCGYSPNQAMASIMNHMFLDSHRYTDRRWKYNRYVATTKELLIEDVFLAEVLAEVVEAGIPDTYYQTGTPVKA